MGGKSLRSKQLNLSFLTSIVIRIFTAIRSSFSIFLVALGIVFIILSLPIEGAMAGMSIIWGVSAIIYAVILSIVLRLLSFS